MPAAPARDPHNRFSARRSGNRDLMRQIVAYAASSIDGFIAGPDDDLTWLPQLEGDEAGYRDFFAGVETLAMGRRTYDVIGSAGEWPYGDVPAYVLSSSLPAGPMEHVTVTPGPPVELAATLREGDGDGVAWLVGGGELFAAFAAADLIDLWIVTVVPVLLGAGTPLVPPGPSYYRLDLVETRSLPAGLVQLHYRPQS